MITQKNLPFFNVVASGVATLQLPLGMTYERIIFKLGGTALTKAMITDIKVKLNGKLIVQTDGTKLNAMNVYRGLVTDATHLVLDFSELFARDEVGQSIGSVATAEGVSSFTIEATITGATAPTLESWSVLSGPRKLGVLAKTLSYAATFGSAGKFNFQLPYGASGGSIIKRVHFFHTNMTDLEVKKNGLVIHDTTDAINKYIQTENGKVTASGLYVADFIVDNNQSGMLVTADARSMEWNLTLSASDTVIAQVEYIDLIGNL
jgi:hypothetical protein